MGNHAGRMNCSTGSRSLPQAASGLPQTTKMQSDMLKLINDRLAMHADQQRKVTEVVNHLGGNPATVSGAKKEYAEALQSIREQIEMGNEIDRQLVESFNRFSMMIDRLQLANQHAVDALQQVRDSYAASAMQMHEWIEKSRHRGGWLVGFAFSDVGDRFNCGDSDGDAALGKLTALPGGSPSYPPAFPSRNDASNRISTTSVMPVKRRSFW